MRARRALTLVVLSAVTPGAAQLARGNRRLGRLALRAWAALLATALLTGLVAVVSERTAVALLVRPSLLRGVELVLLVGLLAWVALLVDAWRLGRPGTLSLRSRRRVAGLVAVLLLLGSAPALVGAHYAAVQRDLVSSVFADGEVTTTGGRMNVLLLGADADDDRVGLRPDSITLASIHAGTGDAVLLGLPRNLQRARFPEGSAAEAAFPGGFPQMLNATYTYGVAHPDLFPGPAGPGIEATKAAVAGTLGLPVHYHVLVDLGGFEDLVDALGGVQVQVVRRVPIGGGTSPVSGYLEPGLRRLDGYQALWYARSREGSNDYERMGRQRCVLAAIARQADPRTVLSRFRAIAGSAKQMVTTDIPQQALPGLVELALRSRGSGLRSVQFVPPAVDTTDPDIPRLQDLAEDALDPRSVPATEPAPAATGGRSAPLAQPAAPGGERTAEPAAAPPAPAEPDPDRPVEVSAACGAA